MRLTESIAAHCVDRVALAAALAVAGLLSLGSATASAALTHRWPADGSPDDIVGTANATLTASSAYAPGLSGEGFRFSGADSATFPILDNPGTGDFTVAFAIQTTMTGVAYVLGKRPACDSTQSFWDASFTGSQGLGMEMYGAFGPPRNGATAVPINDGFFHTIVIVRSGTTVSFYVDGGPAEALTHPDAAIISNAAPMRASGSPCITQPGSVFGFVGVLDEIRYADSAEPSLLPPPAPVSLTSPAIAASGDPGAAVPCSAGTWRYNPGSFGRQWLRDGVPIDGASGDTYTLTAADAGRAIVCRVNATNAGGATSADSNLLNVSAPPPVAGPQPAAPSVPVAQPQPKPASGAPAPVTITQIATLPSPKTCVSRRRFPIRLRGVKANGIVRAQVRLNGKRVRNVTGNALALPIDLRGLPKGRFIVEIVTTNAAGKRLVGKRTYRTCVPKTR